MALISCPDCQSQVSDLAPACPKCGRPFSARKEASVREGPRTLIARPEKGSFVKRALIGIAAAAIVLPLVIAATWRIVRVATTPEDSPRHALQQLASAARLGLWEVADQYADREAMRQDIRTAFEEQAMNLARKSCWNCEPEFIEAQFRTLARSIAASSSEDVEAWLVKTCQAADDNGVVITVSSDGETAVAKYPPVRGIALRLGLKRAVGGGKWKVASVPSALENLEIAGKNVEKRGQEFTRK